VNLVFISHSTSKTDTYSKTVRDLVAAGLKDNVYTVLLDTERLTPGENWRPRIYQWLRECRAAVVLLNRSALDSPWVKRETDILMWRRSFNPSLVVLAAPVGGVRSGDVAEAGFRELSELQWVRESDGRDSSALSPEETAEIIIRQFPPLKYSPADELVGQWIDDISAQFVQVRQSDRLIRVGRALGLAEQYEPQLRTANEVSCTFLAAQMLHTHEPSRLRRAVSAVHRYLDASSFGHLVSLVLPVWIDAASASSLINGSELTVAWTAILSVLNPDTAKQYLNRAYCMDETRYCVIPASTGEIGEEEPVESLKYECERALRRSLNLSLRQSLADAREVRGCHVYVVLDAVSCTLQEAGEVISWLHDQLPWLRVVLIPPVRLTHDDVRPGKLADALLVVPPFDSDDEQEANTESRLMIDLGGLRGVYDATRR
jgi:hypothetical protein